MRTNWLLIALVGLLGACGAAEVPATANAVTASPQRTRPCAPSKAMLDKLLLPAAVRGRWGITPADCDDTIDDNKGLMLVEPGSLRFPDGSAAVHVVNAVGPNQWRADFLVADGGERRWETITLTLSNEGKTLTRMAGSQSLSYRRCEARP